MSKLIIILGLLSFVAGDSPLLWDPDGFNFNQELTTTSEEKVYRLPNTVEPFEYDIYLDLYFEGEDIIKPFSYDGRVYIKINVLKENVKEIVLHANVDNVHYVRSRSASDLPGVILPDNEFEIDSQYNFLKIHFNESLTVGEVYILLIDFSSTMNEGPLKRGIWRGWYKDEEGNERVYATTHFQPYNARQAFPCWDEPLFKAIFTLHISRPANFSETLSNTAIEQTIRRDAFRVQDDFLPTPKMSTYLLTFLVSESFEVIAEDSSFTPPIRIIGRSDTVGLGDFALDVAVKMTQFFSDYFQIPYSTLHKNLNNDHISSPDWASAGTENWGMISYRELYTIIDPSETIMSVEHYAVTLISHELAHSWFGNLITCAWWSNTWINEGFASYFGYIASNEKFPKYEFDEHFNSRYLQNSLSSDSNTGTVPLNHDVNTPAQITGHFGTVSYSKGAAFLRMTADIITPETFRKACQYFLQENKFKPTDQNDLLDAFEKAITEDKSLSQYKDFKFVEYYTVWVNEPGYPILNVDVKYDTGEIWLQQERFFISPDASPSNQIYPIPITYSTKRNADFKKVTPVFIMNTEKAVLMENVSEEWVIFNNLQHGHYRVNYDDKTWNLIADALLNDRESIHHLNRAQVVDDVFALIRSERMTYDKGFEILRFLKGEDNYHVWTVAISGYSWIRNRLRHLPESLAAFDEFVLSYMEHVIEAVGFEPVTDESPTISLTRQEVLQFACYLGHEGCTLDSLNRFANMTENGEWIDPRIRRNVYMMGVRHGDEKDFHYLLKRMQESNFANDQLEMLRGLASTKIPELLTEYLDLTLGKEVRWHDKVNAFNYALQGNDDNVHIVLDFVKNNIDNIREAYVEDSPANTVHSVLSNLASYLDEEQLEDYEQWLRTTQSNSLQFDSAISSINSARRNIAWGKEHADIILAAAKDGGTVINMSVTMLIFMAMITVIV